MALDQGVELPWNASDACIAHSALIWHASAVDIDVYLKSQLHHVFGGGSELSDVGIIHFHSNAFFLSNTRACASQDA